MSKSPLTLKRKVGPNSVAAFLAYLLLFVSMAAVGVIAVFFNIERSSNKRLLSEIGYIADIKTESIRDFLEHVRIHANERSRDGLVRSGTAAILRSCKDPAVKCGPAEELSERLRLETVKMSPTIRVYDVLNKEGVVIASSDRKTIGVPVDGNNRIIFSKTLAAPVTESMTGLLVTEMHEFPGAAFVHLANQIVDLKSGEIIGVLLSHVDLTEIDSILTVSSTSLNIYIVDSNKQIVTASRIDQDAKLSQVVDTLPVTLGLYSGRAFSGFYKDYRGREVLGVSRILPNGLGLVIVEMPNKGLAAHIIGTLTGSGRMLALLAVAAVVLLAFAINFIKVRTKSGRLNFNTQKSSISVMAVVLAVLFVAGVGGVTSFRSFMNMFMRDQILEPQIRKIQTHGGTELQRSNVFYEPQTPLARETFLKFQEEVMTDDIRKIRVFDRDSRVIFSTDESEAGKIMEKEDIETALLGENLYKKVDPGKAETLGSVSIEEVYIPIINKQTGRVEGVIEAYLSKDRPLELEATFMTVVGGIIFMTLLLTAVILSTVFRRQNVIAADQANQITAIFDNAPGGMYVIDRSGMIINVNRRMLEISGLEDPAHIIGSNVFDGRMYQDSGISTIVKEALQGNKAEKEVVFESGNGEVIWRLYTAVPILGVDKDQQIEKAIVHVQDITRRKQLELQLQGYTKKLESLVQERTKDIVAVQERLRSVVENAPIVLFAVDADGVFTLSEGSGLATLGLKPGEVVGKTVQEVYAGVPKIEANIERARKGEKFAEIVEVGELSFETHYSPLLDGKGASGGVIGVALDVTEQMKTEKARHLNATMFDSLVRNSHAGVLVEDASRRVLAVNQQLCEIFGQADAHDKCLGTDTRAMTDKMGHAVADPKEFSVRVEELSGKREAVSQEDIFFADGRIFERDYLPINTADGSYIGNLWQYRDVTERRATFDRARVGTERQKAVADIGLQALSTEDVSQIMDEAITMVRKMLKADFSKILELTPDAEGLVLRAGAGWKSGSIGSASVPAGTGSPAGYAIMRREPVIIYDIASESRFSMPKLLSDHGITSGIIVHIMADGKPYGVLGVDTKTSRMFTSDEIQFLQAVANIIGTAIERSRAKSKIEQLDILRNKFIEIVSHQLRTPLNVVRWNLESLIAEELGGLEPAQHEFLRVTYNANAMVIERIRDLLTSLDIEENRLVFRRERVSFEGLWLSVMGDWQKRCKVKGLKCEYEGPKEPLPALSIDSEKIRDVLEKLSENAVVYTKAHGTTKVSISHVADRVRFEISDTGVGIPKEEQRRVFQRFFRATNASTMQPDSSGLGLSIAKYYVEQHGGRIGFTSEEDKGSMFWFELPLDPRHKPMYDDRMT